VLASMAFTIRQAIAQLNPLAGLYFHNQYLGNPALAGIDKGLVVNLGFRKQWSAMPGAPQTQSLTAEYGTAKKMGLGLSIYNDEAGLLKRSRVMGTYSYHLPLNEETHKLRFGLSFGFMDERVMNEQINGEQNDVAVGKFNQRETYIDGDFGAAYTTERLIVQFAVPNMKGFLQKDDVNTAADRSLFFSSVSYKLYFPSAVDGLGIEPRVGFRGIHGFKNILDLGANFTVANGAANVMTIFHSSQSATFGMGAVIKSLGSINANYTTSTAALKNYTDGNFQLSLRLNLVKEEKKSN
jgi:type IX secretion system PorP/SprF family membrane protein